jgi:hypothetical protein
VTICCCVENKQFVSSGGVAGTHACGAWKDILRRTCSMRKKLSKIGSVFLSLVMIMSLVMIAPAEKGGVVEAAETTETTETGETK